MIRPDHDHQEKKTAGLKTLTAAQQQARRGNNNRTGGLNDTT